MKTMAALLASVATVFGFSPAATTTSPVIDQHCVTINRYLSVGSTGTDVSQLQKFLGIKPTGFFGLQTQSALVKWQVATHVLASAKSDGAGGVGPKTRFALQCKTPINATSSSKIIPLPPVIVPTNVAPTQTNTVAPPPSGGGSGSVTAPSCAPFTQPKPAASQCVIGQWVLISNEANCPVEWDCQSNSNDPE